MGVIVIGAGIGGLTLGLALHRAGIPCHIYEAAPEIAPIGVGINLLPHATRELAELDLETALARVGVSTAEACFFNRFGQLIYREPLGRAAGYSSPQFSIHRGDLQQVLADAFVCRAGADHLITGWRWVAFEQAEDRVTVHFENAGTGDRLPPQHGAVAIACDGIHSVIRKQLYPDEGEPLYSGYNMWRGVSRWPPFLSGASMVQAGWLATGKMVIYPIRNDIDGEGRQLVNWVAEIETPRHHAGLEPARGARRLFRRLQGLAFRLARRAGDDQCGRHDPRIPDGRSGPAAPLELWPRDTARRCGTSDGAAWLKRRRPGDRRRPRAGRFSLCDRRPGRGLARL
jgi:2-polyprenyl-6-methoxyphenol hydroxylase-like FAD-dependent oxidoreductase